MKAKLIKTPEQLYKLKFYNDEDMLACATALLSKKNCDELFGVVDVEKLANEAFPDESEPGWRDSFSPRERKGFKSGFNKAMELNKDKVFTLEQVLDAFYAGWISKDKTYPEAQKSYKGYLERHVMQPTEIEVEIEMEYYGYCEGCRKAGIWHCAHADTCGYAETRERPKLDSEGYLILKKI
jgi:hypothetical protein